MDNISDNIKKEIINSSLENLKKIMKKSNLNHKEIDDIYKKYPDIIFKIEIKDKNIIFHNKWPNIDRHIRKYFRLLLHKVNKNGIIYFHQDRYPNLDIYEKIKKLPLFGKSINFNNIKNDNDNLILLPNDHIFYKINNISDDDFNFEEKKELAIWRFGDCHPKRHLKRIKLANKLNNNFFDIKITGNEKLKKQMKKICNLNDKYFSEKFKMSIDDMRKYKFLLECDGHESIFWKLRSKSVVVNFENHLKTKTFIDYYIKKNIHYIDGDKVEMNKLEEYLKNINNEKYKNIINNANTLIKIFDYDFLCLYTKILVENYFDLIK